MDVRFVVNRSMQVYIRIQSNCRYTSRCASATCKPRRIIPWYAWLPLSYCPLLPALTWRSIVKYTGENVHALSHTYTHVLLCIFYTPLINSVFSLYRCDDTYPVHSHVHSAHERRIRYSELIRARVKGTCTKESTWQYSNSTLAL